MKDIYDLSNETRVNLEKYEVKELNDLEKQKIRNIIKPKKKKNWKKVIGTVAAAMVVLMVFGQTNTGKDVYAAAKEYLLDKYNVAFKMPYSEDEISSEYIEDINITKEYQDYNIQLKNVIKDGEWGHYRLLIQYKNDIDYDDAFIAFTIDNKDWSYDDFNADLIVDGKKVEIEMGQKTSYLIDKENNILQLDFDIKYSNKELKEIKDNSKIEFNLKGLTFIFDKDSKKEAIVMNDVTNFDISNNFKDSSHLNKEYEIMGDKKFKDNDTGIEFEINSVKFNPFSQRITLDYIWSNEENSNIDLGLFALGMNEEYKEVMFISEISDYKNENKQIELLNAANGRAYPIGHNYTGIFKDIENDSDEVNVDWSFFDKSKREGAKIDEILKSREIKFKLILDKYRIINEEGDGLFIGMEELGEFTIKLK